VLNKFTLYNNVATEESPVITLPAVKIDQEAITEILSQIHEENTVIVHCTYNSIFGGSIRIWKSTFLVAKTSGDRSKLLHAENITYAPVWTPTPAGKSFRFSLIFSGLPKDCEFFDLLEDIPESGGFFIQNIKRNKNDIYQVNIM
jgi:hypothetical protein